MNKQEIAAAKQSAKDIMATATEQELRDYAREGGDTQPEAIVRVAAKRELSKRGLNVKRYAR